MAIFHKYFFSAKNNFDAYLYGPEDGKVDPWTSYFSNETSNKRVCYEFEWLYGNSKFGVGFSNENFSVRMAFYPFNPPRFQVEYIGTDQIYRITSDPPLILKRNIPILVCINIEKKLFTMIHKENEAIFNWNNFTNLFDPKYVHVAIHPGASGNKFDRLYLNFGRYAFKLPLQEGYEPFFKYIPESCQNHNQKCVHIFIYCYICI